MQLPAEWLSILTPRACLPVFSPVRSEYSYPIIPKPCFNWCERRVYLQSVDHNDLDHANYIG